MVFICGGGVGAEGRMPGWFVGAWAFDQYLGKKLNLIRENSVRGCYLITRHVALVKLLVVGCSKRGWVGLSRAWSAGRNCSIYIINYQLTIRA